MFRNYVLYVVCTKHVTLLYLELYTLSAVQVTRPEEYARKFMIGTNRIFVYKEPLDSTRICYMVK